MAAIKALDRVAQKWATVTPQRANEYREGVQAPRVDWAEATRAGSDNWATGVQQAVTDNSFTKGVDRAGTAKWKRGATTKGVQRWGPGIQLAQTDYQAGFQPYHEAIAALNLPPRFPRRDPRNIERVRAIAEAMMEVKRRIG